MSLPFEDTELRQAALAYVMALYEELTEENGAPTLGTQNQAVDFILAEPDLRRAIAEWAAGTADFTEAKVAPVQRPPQDTTYNRVRAYLERIIEKPVFAAPQRAGP